MGVKGNVWSLNANAKLATTPYTFGGTNKNVDGGYKVRTSYFSLYNSDSTFNLGFSVDSSAWLILIPGQSFAQPMMIDSFYTRNNDSTTLNCQFQSVATLKSDRWPR